MNTTLTLGTTHIHILPTGTLIEFADGTSVPGAPEDTEDYRATAIAHGYGTDTLKLCIDHEITHVKLAHWLGVRSPTMDAVRFGRLHDHLSLRQLEEAAVLAVQRYARAVQVDLAADG